MLKLRARKRIQGLHCDSLHHHNAQVQVSAGCPDTIITTTESVETKFWEQQHSNWMPTSSAVVPTSASKQPPAEIDDNSARQAVLPRTIVTFYHVWKKLNIVGSHCDGGVTIFTQSRQSPSPTYELLCHYFWPSARWHMFFPVRTQTFGCTRPARREHSVLVLSQCHFWATWYIDLESVSTLGRCQVKLLMRRVEVVLFGWAPELLITFLTYCACHSFTSFIQALQSHTHISYIYEIHACG